MTTIFFDRVLFRREMASFRSSLALFILMAIIGAGDAGNVTYDGRSLIIDGQHKILFSGSIHYPRSTPHDTFYLRLHLPLLLLRIIYVN